MCSISLTDSRTLLLAALLSVHYHPSTFGTQDIRMFGTPQFLLPLLRCPFNSSWSQTHQMPCVRREFRLSIFSILFKTLLQTLLSSLLSRLFTSLWALFESNTFWFSSSQIITSITVLVHRFLYLCSFFASPNPLPVLLCVFMSACRTRLVLDLMASCALPLLMQQCRYHKRGWGCTEITYCLYAHVFVGFYLWRYLFVFDFNFLFSPELVLPDTSGT